MPEHHIHVTDDRGTRTMTFQGVSVPRAGERMKLLSPGQQIDGEYVVVDVKWLVTNRNQGTARYRSEAQAEVWVELPRRTPQAKRGFARRWVLIVPALILVGIVVGYLYVGGVIP